MPFKVGDKLTKARMQDIPTVESSVWKACLDDGMITVCDGFPIFELTPEFMAGAEKYLELGAKAEHGKVPVWDHGNYYGDYRDYERLYKILKKCTAFLVFRVEKDGVLDGWREVALQGDTIKWHGGYHMKSPPIYSLVQSDEILLKNVVMYQVKAIAD